MKIFKTNIQDLVLYEPGFFKDQRGYFTETYNKNLFNKIIGKINFVQDNLSKSKKGTLRGLHFQKPPFDQAKMVRCIQGEILDVVVDLRNKSKTFGHYESFLLSGNSMKNLFIPRGFAHGFLVLSETAIFSYKVDNLYSKDHESGIIWNDNSLNIDWGDTNMNLIISQKDNNLPSFNPNLKYF